MSKYISEQNYTVGNSHFMTFAQGNKGKQDYIISWNGNMQFHDLDLFDKLHRNILCYKCAFNFIRHFICSGFIELEQNCIKSNIKNVQDIIHFVNHTLLPDDLKLCLASMIFRCDIDNINYECPRLNGCVRHFLQVLMIFGYKFNLSNWQMLKLNNRLQFDNAALLNIPKLISDIGYPNNQYQIGKQDFYYMYQAILPSLEQKLFLY